MAPPSTTEAAARAGSWLARVIGAGLLIEQGADHLIGMESSLLLVGAGLFLLTGREGVEFLRLLLGRSEQSSGRSDAPPDSD